MEFHRRHLLLFMGRFRQFVLHFETPSSSLLSHEIFLIVEAATVVARSDWAVCEKDETELRAIFPSYFEAFDELRSGSVPLGRGATLCLDALSAAGDSSPQRAC